MSPTERDYLIQLLHSAGKLSSSDLATLHKMIEQAARDDLYGTARLWKEHATGDVRMPRILLVAEIAQTRFEGQAARERPPVPLFGERDAEVARPSPGRNYTGPMVGTTPDYLVQRVESGDYVLHERQRLAGNMGTGEVAVHYPFAVHGGVGLVQPATHIVQPEINGPSLHAHRRDHAEMEHSL